MMRAPDAGRARDLRPMSLLLTWLRMGRPEPGPIRTHTRNTYPFEEGAEVAARLEAAFGDLSRLSAVDLGAGPGESAIAKQVLDIPWKRLASVDAFLPYLHKLQAKKCAAQQHDVHDGRIEHVFEDFPAKEFDIALMIDSLEHLTRGNAMKMLTRLENFVTMGVVVFVPIGKVEQEPYDMNALQRHLSFWKTTDLAKLGYSVDHYEAFHGHLKPAADAAWAIKDVRKRRKKK